MWFTREKHARWAAHVAKDMIKLVYAERIPDELPWVREAIKYPSLSQRYLAYRREAEAYDLDSRNTALEWLHRDRTTLCIERCQDICRWTGIECTNDLVPQLFFAYALRFPQVAFTAMYRHEVTVTGAIQLIRIEYDGVVMHAQEKTGERPMDEEDWSGEPFYDFTAVDGVFRMQRMTDLKNGIKELRSQEPLRILRLIHRRCNPLLVVLGGNLAYGLDTSGQNDTVRGIFLNPREEWIGLQPEQESLCIEGSDVMLYGLRRAVTLLLDCDPDALEMLGSRREHILHCTEDGWVILDNAPLFLSRRAIFTFNTRAMQLRRDIRKKITEGHANKQALAQEMMDLIRIYAMGGELLQNGCAVTYRENERELLMDILSGKYQDRKGLPTETFDSLAEEYRGAFNGAAISTRLPMEPDSDRVNALMMEIVHRSL
jgi:hypothetical protein